MILIAGGQRVFRGLYVSKRPMPYTPFLSPVTPLSYTVNPVLIRTLKGLCHAIFCYSTLNHFFTISELKHVDEIRSKRWNLTPIANIDDFVALFCHLPLVSE